MYHLRGLTADNIQFITHKKQEMSYYKMIDGVNYEKALLDLADELSQGQGDGRIAVADLQQISKAVCDGGTLTDTERLTYAYILENYTLTEAAQAWYRDHMR